MDTSLHDDLRHTTSSSTVHNVTELQILARLLANTRARQPIKDAQNLISRYGSVADMLCIPETSLVSPEINDNAAQVLRALKLLFVDGAHRSLKSRPVMKDDGAIITYLQWKQGRAETEELRALYFDAKCQLIEDKVQARGTGGRVIFDPHIIIRDGVRHGAYGIVVAHNHPSGDPWPSEDDIQMTAYLVKAAIAVGMVLYDHLIVAHGRSFSFRAAELIS